MTNLTIHDLRRTDQMDDKHDSKWPSVEDAMSRINAIINAMKDDGVGVAARDLIVLMRELGRVTAILNAEPASREQTATDLWDGMGNASIAAIKDVLQPLPEVEELAHIIDPEAFGLPNNEEDGTITDRDAARDRARLIIARYGYKDKNHG
jgi:hypothetical protein